MTKAAQRISTLLLAATVVGGGSLCADQLLPSWPEQDNGYYPGGGLWPEGTLPESAGEFIAGRENAETSGSSGEVGADPLTEMILVIHEDTEDLPPRPETPAEVPDELPRIEGGLRDAYFAGKPAQLLVDPQKLVTEQRANDVLRFLEFHEEESEFRICAMILGHNQEIPEETDLALLEKTWFGDRATFLAVYQLSRPEDLELVYHPGNTRKLADPTLERIRYDCVRAAKAVDNPSDQLEKLIVELSIQLFQLEQGRRVRNPMAPAPSPPVVSVEKPVEGLPVAGEAVSGTPFEPGRWAIAIRWFERIRSAGPIAWLVLGSSLLLVASMALLLRTVYARRKTSGKKPILFPTCEPRSRLGGIHNGGAFAGISFELGKCDGRME